jgi:hypothetical protein
MTSGTETNLRSLRDRPFELLKELEKRSRAVTAGNVQEAAVGREWVGVAFRMGGETFLVAREETREVLGYPAVVTRIPGAKPWVKGLANVRGQLLPMLDLRQYLGRPQHPSGGGQPSRDSGGTDGGRGVGFSAIRRVGIQRRSAADRDPLRYVSGRRLSPRWGSLAGLEFEELGGESELFAGR